MQNLDQLSLGYCTLSAGSRPEHTLPLKLQAIAAAGFQCIELGFPDLVAYAQQELGDSFGGEEDWDTLEETAKTIHHKCEELGLYIATIVPFGPYGGFATDKQRQDALGRAEGWFRIIRALGRPMLQCGTSNLPDASDSLQDYVRDLGELADMAAKHDIKIAYEQWCWGTHLNTWQHSWEVVKQANRPNLGLCLDTFQITGRAYADPASQDGIDHSLQPDPESHLRQSLHELVTTVDPSKIYYLQLSSACKMEPPLSGKAPREEWSTSYRPMPFKPEYNEYLPVMPALEAVLKTGWRGPLTVETFMAKDLQQPGEDVPFKLAREAYMIIKTKMLAAFEV